jgi:hypothetical protein
MSKHPPISINNAAPSTVKGLTPEQVEALEALRRKLEPHREFLERRQRQSQADLERHGADWWWREYIERPRAARRIETAQRVAPAVSRPTRPGRITVKRRARAARTSTPSRGDPDDDPDEPSEQTWALTFVDRAPVFWRFGAARCRFMEWREGVDR